MSVEHTHHTLSLSYRYGCHTQRKNSCWHNRNPYWKPQAIIYIRFCAMLSIHWNHTRIRDVLLLFGMHTHAFSATPKPMEQALMWRKAAVAAASRRQKISATNFYKSNIVTREMTSSQVNVLYWLLTVERAYCVLAPRAWKGANKKATNTSLQTTFPRRMIKWFVGARLNGTVLCMGLCFEQNNEYWKYIYSLVLFIRDASAMGSSIPMIQLQLRAHFLFCHSSASLSVDGYINEFRFYSDNIWPHSCKCFQELGIRYVFPWKLCELLQSSDVCVIYMRTVSLLIKNYQRSLELLAKTKDAAHSNALSWIVYLHSMSSHTMPCQIADTYIKRSVGSCSVHHNTFCSIHVLRLSSFTLLSFGHVCIAGLVMWYVFAHVFRSCLFPPFRNAGTWNDVM